ncbi:aldose epimerase family protein [Spirosoma montaniterrae]|uniref:Aldose 1-epimerase n=1 Tax=Spirosoma montaniterrae TaxID=1178516 RepID=A0A1P9WSQ4_9BACT|nr:aldose epimerase family protein [Spirosoma montaniterrae]AQG78397.1 galactose mutarotase [Spirosoma montaniterrae]
MKQFLIPAAVVALLHLAGCQSSTKTKEADTELANTPAAGSPDADTATQTTMIDYKLPDPKAFGGEKNGKTVTLHILKNDNLHVAITNFGARVVGLLVPDKTGKLIDVVPGFATLKAYEAANESFFGPIVGRFGNRIAKGRFTIDGKAYQTELNNNGNTLHAGPTGFHNQVWDAKQIDDKSLELTYVSKDGEGGFPGTVTTKVIYTLTDTKGLRIDYTATTDKPTPYNPTNHAFFNLNGEGSGTINNHVLMIDADRFSAVDKGLIPQGEPISVEGTPFDFRTPTAIGKRVNDKNEQLTFGAGYDHNFVLNKKSGGLAKGVEITGDQSGIRMEVLTTEPAMQFYGGNFFKGADTGKYGKAIGYREAFALEAQHYPDSPNHPTYPNTILRPGQTYKQTTEYRFSVAK